jgi:hypothetical protein
VKDSAYAQREREKREIINRIRKTEIHPSLRASKIVEINHSFDEQPDERSD